MTPRQRQCLDFIETYWSEYGYAPSHDEILDGINAGSKSVIARLIRGLQTQGRVTFVPYKARSVRPIDRPAKLKCPRCGWPT